MIGPGGMELICINGSIAVNVTGNTTGNSSSADDFNDKMSTYAFYYLYLSAIVLVAGYFQVNTQCRVSDTL